MLGDNFFSIFLCVSKACLVVSLSTKGNESLSKIVSGNILAGATSLTHSDCALWKSCISKFELLDCEIINISTWIPYIVKLCLLDELSDDWNSTVVLSKTEVCKTSEEVSLTLKTYLVGLIAP